MVRLVEESILTLDGALLPSLCRHAPVCGRRSNE